PLWAHPYMIRLGYSTCATCHVSPQGGGLLTVYGQGVEGALSLRTHEYETREDQEGPRVLYDIRALAVGNWTSAAPPSSFQALFLGSVKASAHQRLTYTVSVTNPTLTTATGGGGAATVDAPTLVWQYRPVDGFELMVGRDALPAGVQSPDPLTFIRTSTDPGSSAYPTQIKAFWWNKRLQVTPYAFGPAGNEAAENHEWGGGGVAGVAGWKQRAVIGVSNVEARGSTFDRRSVGMYTRLGFGKWAVLAEHQVIGRNTDVTTGYVAGHTRVIFVPYQWLETWMSTEDLVTYTPTHAHTLRFTPGCLLRVSENLMAGFMARDVITPKGRFWTYSLTLALRAAN